MPAQRPNVKKQNVKAVKFVPKEDEMAEKLAQEHSVPEDHNEAAVKNKRVIGWTKNRLS